MPIPGGIPQPDVFSISPILQAHQVGTQMRYQAEDRNTAEEERMTQAISAMAYGADTPEKWAAMMGALQRRFPDADLSQFADFSTRDMAIGQGLSVMDQFNMDMARRADARASAAAGRAGAPSQSERETAAWAQAVELLGGEVTPGRVEPRTVTMEAAEPGAGEVFPGEFEAPGTPAVIEPTATGMLGSLMAQGIPEDRARALVALSLGEGGGPIRDVILQSLTATPAQATRPEVRNGVRGQVAPDGTWTADPEWTQSGVGGGAEPPPTEAIERPDGTTHLMGWNPETRRYDIDFGVTDTPDRPNLGEAQVIGNGQGGLPNDGQLYEILYDPETGKISRVLGLADPGGVWSATVSPDGTVQIAQGRAATGPTPEERQATRVADSQTALRYIDRALEQATGFTTGFFGGLLGNIPIGTPQYDLAQTLTTIRSTIGINEIQEMRRNSPTGAAAGQMTQQEWPRFESLLGSVQQGQSIAQLQWTLTEVKAQFLDMVHGSGNWFYDEQGNVILRMPDGATQPWSYQRPLDQLPPAARPQAINGTTPVATPTGTAPVVRNPLQAGLLPLTELTPQNYNDAYQNAIRPISEGGRGLTQEQAINAIAGQFGLTAEQMFQHLGRTGAR